MKIPKASKRKLNIPVDQAELKRYYEALLNKLDKRPKHGAPDLPFHKVKARFHAAVNILLLTSVLGSFGLLTASLYYLSIPSPSIYITTQHGLIFPINPIKTRD
jgi:hypothetical protein